MGQWNRLAALGRRVLAALLLGCALAAHAYDPLSLPSEPQVDMRDMTVQDAARHRSIPIRLYLPASRQPASVVLFSHGLGGSRETCAYLGAHWAGRGYIAVFLQHPGSDTGVWRDQPRRQRMRSMEQAANGENFMLRVGDVTAVLDELTRWNAAQGHELYRRLDMTKVGMSGHSFGAVTTQAVSGQSFGAGRLTLADPRIKAAIAFSPSSPRVGKPARAFSNVSRPWMLMTGTRDTSVIGDTDVASRLAVYPALPPGGKYEVVLFNAEHSAFTDRALPGDRMSRNPNHHRVILALSTAFWDAWLKELPEARAWLDGDGPRTVLEPEDRWQHK